MRELAKAHSAAVGFDHAAYVTVGGAVVRKHEIEYLAPALEGDELQLITWIESWTAVAHRRARQPSWTYFPAVTLPELSWEEDVQNPPLVCLGSFSASRNSQRTLFATGTA